MFYDLCYNFEVSVSVLLPERQFSQALSINVTFLQINNNFSLIYKIKCFFETHISISR